MQQQKLWGGRFQQGTENLVEEFTASINFDYLLAQDDILGSLAHTRMLGHCGILTHLEAATISNGLKQIAKHLQDAFPFTISDEDIHMNIERLLTAEIGELAGKLHTARSRNDQVSLDTHLYLRRHLLQIMDELVQFQRTLILQAKQHIDVILPGYTHLQRAQPIRFAHHLLAYQAMLQRDCQRLQDSWPRLNQLPLGAGALAGTSFPIDRHYTAALLGFDGIYPNSLDAVSDRDFIVEFLANAAMLMAHLSRFSEEIILWSSQEFGFIELADGYCTGSSIMPQKKNPDIPELTRGKTGRVYGALFNVLTLLKGLPLAYNRDLQEDKEPLFDTVKTLHQVLGIYPGLLSSMKVNAQSMMQATEVGFLNATDLADYMAKQGLPFRKAHEIAGQLVQYCLQHNCTLTDLSLEQFQAYSLLINKDIYSVLSMKNVVETRNSAGGTAKDQVLQQLNLAEQWLTDMTNWLTIKQQLIQNVVEDLF